MFVTLFNLQGARRSLAAGVYFTISFSSCQALFSSFLKLFQRLFKRGPIRLTPRPPSRTTCLYYHLFLVLSSTFFKSFSICFVLNFALEGSFLPPSRTAYVGYHHPPRLSSTFFLFFALFSSHTPFYPLRHLIEYDKMTCFPSGFPLLRTRNIAIPVYSYIGNGYLS